MLTYLRVRVPSLANNLGVIERLLIQRLGRLRDVAVSSEGVVYLLTDGPEGMLYRLEPRDGDEVAIK